MLIPMRILAAFMKIVACEKNLNELGLGVDEEGTVILRMLYWIW